MPVSMVGNSGIVTPLWMCLVISEAMVEPPMLTPEP
jgi:hypothetical protein